VLSGIITPLRPKPINKKRTVTEKLENLLLTPVSDFILNPRAEPVDIPPTELFEPLYTYLQNEENKNIDEIIFKKGTICVDGRLDLCKQVVGPKGINGLIESLKLDSATPDPKIRHLLLGNNVCGNELGIAIGKFIKSGKSALTTWYIAGNNLDADGIAPICEALYGDEQIRQLWLKRNPIRAKGIPHIANMFKHNTYLQVLDLTNTGLMDEGAILLLNNLSQTLKYLYLSSNGLTVKTCEEIANVLHTTTLDSIALGCNRLTDNGAFYISKALEHPDCPLKSIEIASCAIGPVGTKYLAGALMTNKTLIHLNFGFLKSTSDLEEIPNIIGSLGASYLAGSLTINSTLRSLDLIHTGIQQAGISAIANVLSTKNNTANITANITLLYLNIEQFGIPHNELSREIIRKSLQRNKEYVNEETLKYIELYVNPPHLEEIKSVYRIK
jgi:Ran GTPase-activating protein (RanGAP) involved in mRNA processing and transport